MALIGTPDYERHSVQPECLFGVLRYLGLSAGQRFTPLENVPLALALVDERSIIRPHCRVVRARTHSYAIFLAFSSRYTYPA